MRPRAIVGPWDSRLKHGWSFVYFHGKAEDDNWKFCLDEDGRMETAPDLVGSDTDLDELCDGLHIVKHSQTGESLFAYLWTYEADYRGPGDIQVRRHGLIVNLDDDKSMDYAEECKRKRVNHL